MQIQAWNSHRADQLRRDFSRPTAHGYVYRRYLSLCWHVTVRAQPACGLTTRSRSSTFFLNVRNAVILQETFGLTFSQSQRPTNVILYIYIYIYLFITDCNWAYARWQCYIKNEQYINSNTSILILGVCILLRVWDQRWECFPSTQL
jgi:hypothetical protein